jgi:hypothetical protein
MSTSSISTTTSLYILPVGTELNFDKKNKFNIYEAYLLYVD